MSKDRIWNDDSRRELRERLAAVITGELRLARNRHEDILERCRDGCILGNCPDSECDAFIQFVADELDRAAARLESEKATWPEVTDCDRLDRVETALRERGILLWQVSPCCDTCTVGELQYRIDAIDDRDPGFRDRVRGYAFFIDQNMADMLAESTLISVCLGYGWLSPDGSEVASDVYEVNALGPAREVCECLRSEGFDPCWDGDFSRKIVLPLNWQRRTMLD